MFKLNIGTVTRTIDEYDKKINILAELRGNINNTASELTELGWSGEARDKFIEYHQRNIAKYEQLEEQLKYMKSVLENDLKPKAVQLKKRSEDFVNCIKRSGSGGALSSDDEGVITFEGNQFSINNNVTNCTGNYYPTMQRKFQEIMDLVGRLEYTSFGISGDIWNAETSLRNQTTSLTDFDDSFNIYCNDIREMESSICSLFGKVSQENIGMSGNNSVISASGAIDQNELRELMLKDSNDLTDEEKQEIEKIKNIIGEDKYNKLKQYYEIQELKEKSKNGAYWDEYNTTLLGPASGTSIKYLYDVNVTDEYEHYIMVCNSEGKDPVSIEEYVNNMGPVWEYTYNHKTTSERISELATYVYVGCSVIDPLLMLGDPEALAKCEMDSQALSTKANETISKVEADYELEAKSIINEINTVEAEAIANKVENVSADVNNIDEMSNTENQLLGGSEWNEYFKQTYGSENVEWTTKATITNTERLKLNNWKYPPKDWLYLKYKDVYNNELYYNQVNGDLNWPKNNGFVEEFPGTEILKKDMLLDRFGEPTGNFFAPASDPYDTRALAPHSEEANHYFYMPSNDFEVVSGKAAPWFGSKGGAKQFIKYHENGKLYTINELIDEGFIIDVTDLAKEGLIK